MLGGVKIKSFYILIWIVVLLMAITAADAQTVSSPVLSNSSGLSKDVQDYVNSVVTTPKTAPVDDVFLNISMGDQGANIMNSITVELSAKRSFEHPSVIASRSYVAKKSDYSIVTVKSKEMKLAGGCGCDDCYCIRPVDVETAYCNLRIPLAEMGDFDNTVSSIKAKIYISENTTAYAETFTNPYYDSRVWNAINWYNNDAWVKWSDNGTALLREGKYDDAITYFDKAIAASDSGRNAEWLLYDGHDAAIGSWDTNIAQVWEAKGDALKALGRISESNESYAMATKLDPDDYGTLPEDIAHQKEMQHSMECMDWSRTLKAYVDATNKAEANMTTQEQNEYEISHPSPQMPSNCPNLGS